MSLSAEEQSALNRLRRMKNSKIGERAHYVLLSGDGKSIKELAAQLSRNEHTIRLWLNRYKTEGLCGLETHQKSGRPAKKAAIIESQLEELLSCKSFTKMEDLIQRIRKLIWHFHEGRTVSTINFNYDAYASLL
ncbi:MAG: hypothetical protein LEGION0403_FIIPPAGN_00435 [Legionella sp.]|uniref:helix-turn-helix domain-containing protein n=1 Tax=Legionella sp. TaxID=459 RepID=UPI003D10877C